jgi:hypothetical protein
MENCVYCDKPLADTDRIRWYSERVHDACYEELLADERATIATERRAEQRNEEVMQAYR